ncbi:uncharacterized protein LOC107607816 [Arachis ipaensis]|uniref:uncharacterized protein LOC107607816 n=1 Tax=Arachis ipaensis TaxID=130454 RepID=UPI000A2B5B06|nr:uncharacterized protein LOC107607816 [Arachis ipaensis]
MGCGGSKVDHLPLVTLCRERRDFLRAASDHRYALAAAHVAYFHSLRDIGEALRKFADHDLVFATASASVTGSSPSSLSSPVLTLPSDQGKPSKNTKTKTKNKIRASTSSTSISHGGDASGSDEIDGGSHIHLSDSDSELRSSSSGHIHIEEEEHDIEEDDEEAPPPYGYGYYHDHEPQDWGHNPQGEGYNSNHTYAFYMKRTAPPGRSMIYEEPQTRVAESGQWPDPQNSYGGYGFGYNGGAGGYFGFPSGSSPPPPGAEYSYYGQQRTASPAAPPPPPAPPSPPRVSAWDFLNVFDSYDNGYSELEDETEQEVLKEVLQNHREKEKKKILNEEKAPPMQNHQQQKQHFRERDFGEGTSNSKAVPVSMPQQRKQQRKNGEGSSNKTVRFHGSSDDSGGGSGSLHEKEIKTSSSPDTIVSRSSPEEEEEDGERLGRKKGVTFEVEATVSAVDGGDSSSKVSSLTTLSPHGTRDLKEVVQEIRDEFETASNVGKEVALLLEACKPPYRSRVAPFKGINVILDYETHQHKQTPLLLLSLSQWWNDHHDPASAVTNMGCGGSKVDHLPLVTLCRERRDFLRAASDHRYALAAAHVAYFHSLRDIGEALRKFADHDLVFATASASVTGSSPSSLSSPVLTLPSDQGKPSKNTKTKTKNKIRASTSSTSISHGGDASGSDEIDGGSHIHLSDSDSELRSSSSGHIHIEEEEHDIEEDDEEAPPPYGYGYYHDHEPQDWGHNPQGEGYNSNHTYAFYMKRTAPPGRSMIYEEPQTRVAESGQWPDPQNSYGGYGFGYNGGAGGYFGFLLLSSPPPPGAEYSYYVMTMVTRVIYLIPELEDETEQEVLKEVLQNHREKEKKKILNEEKAPPMQNHQQQKQHFRERDFGEGTSNSKAVPVSMPQQRKQQRKNGEGSSNKTVRFHGSSDDSGGGSGSLHEKEIKTSSSPDTIVSRSSPEEEEEDGERLGRKKGVTFEVEATVSAVDGGDSSSKVSSLTTLSPHGTRDLKEVVQEIRDEFETASNVGKEVALLLEACKPPYRSRVAPFKVMFSRIVHSLAPSRLPSHPPSRPPVQLSSRAMKMAKAYCGEPGREFNTNPLNLSSTLEKLYAWEKKLYKEVKDEERLRSIYEKQCKRLKTLDNRGAESTKIDATEASIKKLLTKINISIRTVEAISLRIHKLRDDELQPQLAALITGLTRMWKFMLKCHEKQFQAIMESKTHSLKINTGLQRDESLKAILELEKELLNWCSQFNNWVKMQKSYVENLNEWLRRCLLDEPEETADGVVPFSPSRIGAPPVFVICNDWHQAMNRISERGVADAMHEFAQRLHELWEKQDEAQRQRIKAEYLKKDFEMQLRTLRREMGDTEHVHDRVSQKTALSKGHSESGVSPLDDLKVDLDSMKKRLHEERARHKEAIKQARDAASNSLQAGLIPIFKTLESFTSEVVKAHEQVRLQNTKAS